ncbi:transporter substrate-binding domain-containing protein [Gordonia sp. (in: high G+C Gram-positive bacteria)]|uniref:transporter substrate-binding domain-containing protein n=1 Tax=Gordonia sp. (in: high G+C Gram-positive bacteria) TaxID=84139 RepID=UPI003BB7747E
MLAVMMLVAIWCGVPVASAAPREVSVVTHDLTPFAMTTGAVRSGFAIDLWEEIAKRQQWSTRYVQVNDVDEQLQAVAENRADVAVGAISITAERSRVFDFSQPTLNSGLQIVVPAGAQEASHPGLMSFLDLLFSKSMLVWLFAALMIAIVPAHIAWLLERRHPGSMVDKRYFPGIFQAFGWALGGLTSSNDESPRHWIVRSLATLWAFVGIIFVAFYTATLTASLTVEKFESKVAGPADLFGKQVATVGGTTSAEFLRSLGIAATDMANVDEAFAALRDDGYDAVVFDAPVLQYWVAHDGQGIGVIAGPVFEPEDYGMVFGDGDNLRKQVDDALLMMREDGTYDQIKQKWFGVS